MKKIIMLIALMALMTTMVLGYEEPTYTDLGTIQNGTSMECFYGDGIYIYCFDGVFGPGLDANYIKKVEISTGNIERIYVEVQMIDSSADFIYYNGMAYGFDYDSDTVFKINLDGTGLTYLTNPVFPDHFGSCALRPNSDEVWCHFEDWGATLIGYILKYDIGDDTWTTIATEVDTDNTDNGVIQYSDCIFSDDDTMLCSGGYGDLEAGTYILKYDSSTNTSNFYDTSIPMAGGELVVVNGVLYIFGGEDYTVGIQDYIVYFDPLDNSYGTLTTTLPFPRNWGGSWYDGVGTFYILGGIWNNPGYSDNFFKYEFASELPVVEEPVTTTRSDNTAGNAAYIQNIQKAKAAQKQSAVNPIEQFIMNLRKFLLGLFGHEVN